MITLAARGRASIAMIWCSREGNGDREINGCLAVGNDVGDRNDDGI